MENWIYIFTALTTYLALRTACERHAHVNDLCVVVLPCVGPARENKMF